MWMVCCWPLQESAQESPQEPPQEQELGGVDAACTCVCRDILGTVRIKPMYGATIRLPFKLMAPLLLLQSMTPHDVAWRVPSKCCIDLS